MPMIDPRITELKMALDRALRLVDRAQMVSTGSGYKQLEDECRELRIIRDRELLCR